MKVADIPFNRHIAIRSSEKENGVMSLHSSQEMTNHLGTIHASAQYALAEACSGQFMLSRFPEYLEGYVAVLRNAGVKFKKQTKNNIYADASAEDETIQAFKARLDKKHRSILPVRVTIRDEQNNITMQGTFEWYVQRTEGAL